MSHYSRKELEKKELQELKNLLITVWNGILAAKQHNDKDIYQHIDHVRKDIKANTQKKLMPCKSSSTLRNFIKKPNYQPSKSSTTIIDFIVFLTDNYKVQRITNTINDYYDIFYWRTDGSGGAGKSGKETIGIARLKITNWDEAEIKYFYHSQKTPYAYLNGKVDTYNNGIHIYLTDKTGTQEDPISKDKKELNYSNEAELSTKANSYLVLYNADRSKNDLMVGCLSSKNRLQSWAMSSIVVCKKSDVIGLERSSFMSDFTNGKRKVQSVDPQIQYYLSGRQIRTEYENNILDGIENLPTNEHARFLKDFKGTFQNIHFSTNSKKEELKSYIVTIDTDGLANVIKGDGDRNQSFERGRARILSDSKILLQFNYDSITRTFQYSLLLTKNDNNYLEGIYFGIINTELASGRVFLKRIKEEVITEIGGHEILKKIKRIEIGKSTAVNPIEKLGEIADNDPKVLDFFSKNRFDAFTDAGLKNLLHLSNQHIEKIEIPFQKSLPNDVLGVYKCYFNIKNVREQGPKHDSSSYGQILNIVPLKIDKNKVLIKYQETEIEGTYRYEGKDKVMLLFIHETYYISIFFRATKTPKFIYGMFNVMNDDNKLTEEQDSIQSSYLIMEKSSEEFEKLNFNKIIELNDLIKIEKELKVGLVTMVFGHYQRTVLTRERNVKVTPKLERLYPRQKSYRRTFWNSACFNSMRYNECEDEIIKIKLEQNPYSKESIIKINVTI